MSPFLYMEAMYSQPAESVEPTQQQLLDANIELFAHASAIPLQNRLRYLVGDEELEALGGYRYIELDELAAKIGALPEDLIAIMLDLNIPYEKVRADDEGNISLAPGIDAVVADEFNWRQAYREQDDNVSIRAAANILGAKFNTIERLLGSYGIEPTRTTRGTYQIRYYPKPILHRLRAEIMMFPPARRDRTIPQMIGAIGCGREWLEANLSEEYPPDFKRSPSGQVRNYFPTKQEDHLRAGYERLPQATDNMRSEKQIARELGRDVTWVRTRLIKYYRNRQDGFKLGVERRLYDDEVFQALRQESEEQHSIPLIAPDEATLDELIEPLDTTHETAGRVLRQLGIVPVKRLSASNGKVLRTYDVGIRPRLARAIIEDRERQITVHEATIAELSSESRELLTLEQRQRLKIARQQVGMMNRYLRQAREAYEKFMDSLVEKQQRSEV